MSTPKPNGECACGCGRPAPLAQRTNTRKGQKRGQALRFISGHNSRGSTDLTRYVVERTGCWRWTGPLDQKGYGHVHVRGETTGAHRAVFEATHGITLPKEVHLDHLCRNRACVNPSHLQPVTAAENNRRAPRVKLNAAKAASIRSAEGTHSAIARRFGVSRQLVGDIKNGRRWARAAARDAQNTHLERLVNDAHIAKVTA